MPEELKKLYAIPCTFRRTVRQYYGGKLESGIAISRYPSGDYDVMYILDIDGKEVKEIAAYEFPQWTQVSYVVVEEISEVKKEWSKEEILKNISGG